MIGAVITEPRALKTSEDTMQRLQNMAGTQEGNSAQANHFAQGYGFNDWSDLELYARSTCVVVERGLIHFQRVLPTTIEFAWRQISRPELSATWGIAVEFDQILGGNFQFIVPDWKGKIGVYTEHEEIRFDADTGGWTSYRLDQIDGRTVFHLRDYLPEKHEVPDDVKRYPNPKASDQVGGLGTHWPGVLAGWHQGVENLFRLFDGELREFDYTGATNLYHMLLCDYYSKD